MFSLLCVILLYLAHISSALPPSSPSALLIPPPPQLLRNSTNGTVGASVHDLGRYGCTMLPDWFDNSRGAPELNYEDCELAMRQLMADLADFGREKYKWLSLGTPCYLTRGGPRQCIRTPKRYTTRTCTVAITFIRDLEPWPTMPPPPYPATYIASFFSMYTYGKALYDECVLGKKKLGWFAPTTGTLEYSIALSFWQHGSAKDRQLPHSFRAPVETT